MGGHIQYCMEPSGPPCTWPASLHSAYGPRCTSDWGETGETAYISGRRPLGFARKRIGFVYNIMWITIKLCYFVCTISNERRARVAHLTHQLSRHELETGLSRSASAHLFPRHPKIKRLCFLYFICLSSFGLISAERIMEDKQKKKIHFFFCHTCSFILSDLSAQTENRK